MELVCIRDRRVTALRTAPKSNPPAVGARSVQTRTGVDQDFLAGHGDLTAIRASAAGVQRTGDAGDAGRAAVQYDLPGLRAKGTRLHHTFHVQHGVCECATGARLDRDAAAVGLDAPKLIDAWRKAAFVDAKVHQSVAFHVHQHGVAGDEPDLCAIGCQRPAILDLRCDQRDTVSARSDAAFVTDRARGARSAEAEAIGEKVVAAKRQGRSDQPTHVDPGVPPKHNAVWVHKEDATVGLDVAQQPARIHAQHPVEDNGTRRGLGELHPLAAADVERAPVDDGAVTGLRHVQCIGSGALDLHLAVLDDRIGRQGEGQRGAEKREGKRGSQRRIAASQIRGGKCRGACHWRGSCQA
ncbi:hypothetical protein GGR36_000948 [Niveibacterium umoris]|uniref:Uncharacterized protein n=1 Tax=Niveibacterium umoris TaxID=1193620 RepID=A0A840BF33_9RHOO|nr:hypothetical protein [Niveibacterium umoris]MBB4011640.1 hypothetical protein [Niveibacterium umoris]